MKYKKSYIVSLFLWLFTITHAQKEDKTEHTYNYSLKELSELVISTGSIKPENIKSAPSNITIITSQMIEERGYKTLVDICQDIPGFDFMMYNDGGGEYPTFSMNRGMGDIGNPEILVMVDGIIQNLVGFNMSQLWTYENILIDVERIEIIQGPGSVMYGAQAFTGIIHFITKKNNKGIDVNTWYKSDNTKAIELHAVTDIAKDVTFSVAARSYVSNGDNSKDRYDPGNYFKNIKRPAYLLYDYDTDGNFVENIPNQQGGKLINNGFNTYNNSLAIRSKLNYKNNEIGFFYSDMQRAYGSAIVAYEYDLTDKENTNHYRNYHIYAINQTELNSKLSLKSDLVYRSTNIIPDGGFQYLYQFSNLRKNYANYSHQGYLEEKLLYDFNESNNFYFGLKATVNQESERIASLGDYPDSKNSTNSSWDIASEGGGLNQFKKYPTYWVKEIAVYGLWDYQFKDNFSSSFGIRYQYNTEYGSVLNPRFAIDYNPNSYIGAKLIYGRAFREPSIFELHNEFRGNSSLIPQNINTYELELSSLLLKDQLSLKLNIYYSAINNIIGRVKDAKMPSGERFENIGKKKIGGLSFIGTYQVNKQVRIYSNYNYLTGLSTDNLDFYEIDRTAQHKINAGINLKFFNEKFISDLRMNYVGKRKAPETNKWMHIHKGGYAPSYTKINLAISYKFSPSFMTQLLFENLLNEKYYGMGRETGSGLIEDYNYETNINPDGFIPAYHPQPGRTTTLSLVYKFHK